MPITEEGKLLSWARGCQGQLWDWRCVARWEETKGGWEGPGGGGRGQAAVKEEVWRGRQSYVPQAGPWNQGRRLVLHWKQLQKG